jgi:hypothetical protein
MAASNIDIGTFPLSPKGKPQMIVFHVLRIRKIHIYTLVVCRNLSFDLMPESLTVGYDVRLTSS